VNISYMYDLLKKYTEIPGPVGYEDRVHKEFIKDLKPYVEDVKLTNTGNVLAHVPGKGKKVVIFGHADEICYYVRQVTEDGFLKCLGMTGRTDKIGFPYTIIGQKALVLGENADARGVFTTKSGHLLTENERNKPIEYTDVICDIGANDIKEVEDKGIHVASPIIWNPTTERLGDKVFGKAMDDRLAHAIEIKLAEKLVGTKLNCDVYLASTIQEEYGLKGASDLARGGYDVSIALDIGIAGDYPAIEKGRANIKLGGGPGIVWKDGSIHYNVETIHEIQAVAKKNGIPYQHGLFTGYGSDSSVMISGGARPALITPPCRYSHQPHEMMHLKDLEWTVDLLYHYVTD
jgi:putative aminopeptidase FrvX